MFAWETFHTLGYGTVVECINEAYSMPSDLEVHAHSFLTADC